MTEVWRDTTLTGNTRMIALALADSANDEGVCWPSIATIARKANCGEATVYRSLSELERSGYLDRSQRVGRSTIYTISATPTPLKTGPHPSQSETPPLSKRYPHPSQSETQNPKGTQKEPKGKGANAPGGHGPPPATQQRAKPKRHLPATWTPTQQHRSKALKLSLDCDSEADKFRNYWHAQGRPMADWGAAFHSWLTRAAEYQRRTPPLSEPPRDRHGRIISSSF